MVRPITMFTGPWTDLPQAETAAKARQLGLDGLELACQGDHFDVRRALREPDYCDRLQKLLEDGGLRVYAISVGVAGRAVLDGGEQASAREVRRAVETLQDAARAAQRLGVGVVNGSTGSSIQHLLYSYPPVAPGAIDRGFELLAERFHPILDVFGECGVRFALDVRPSEAAYDFHSARRALEALDRRDEFGFNFDPSRLIWQGVDPTEFLREFSDRIYHVRLRDAIVRLDGRSSILGSWFPQGDPRRGWNFRSPGRGDVRFEEILRTLNEIDYRGPLSIDVEDVSADREYAVEETCRFMRMLDFSPSGVAFDAAFDRKESTLR